MQPVMRRHIDNFGYFPADIPTTCRLHGMTLSNATPRVFDVFLFNDEVDLLEIRLHELASAVDVFVLIESATSFTGQPKPLIFQQVKDQPRFAPFLPQIAHHIHGVTRTVKAGTEEEYFKVENTHRGTTMLRACLKAGMRLGDIYLISDADEIPRKEVIQTLKACGPWPEPRIQLELRWYKYSFSRPVSLGQQSQIALACSANVHLPFGDFGHGWPEEGTAVAFRDAGWHCQWCFPALEDFRSKALRYSHRTRFDTRHNSLDLAAMQRRICEGSFQLDGSIPEAWSFLDLVILSRPMPNTHSSIDSPAFVRRNPRRFAHLLNKCIRPVKADISQPSPETYGP